MKLHSWARHCVHPANSACTACATSPSRVANAESEGHLIDHDVSNEAHHQYQTDIDPVQRHEKRQREQSADHEIELVCRNPRSSACPKRSALTTACPSP